MSECTIFMRVYGLAEDEDGNKSYAGLKMCLVEFQSGKELSYKQPTALAVSSKENLLNLTGLKGIIKPEDIEIITPEKYQAEFEGE